MYKTAAMMHLLPRTPIGIRVVMIAAVAVILAGAGAGAQTPGAAPRTADGKPDFSGIWQVMNTAAWDIQDHQARKGVPAGMGVVEGNEIPYQPSALAKKRENFAEPRRPPILKPSATCQAFRGSCTCRTRFRSFRRPRMVTMLFEYVHATRYVYTNGTPHPPGHIDWWMGDSRGRWEGDTLVVDVVDFNDQTWFDRAGNFHSEELHLVERFTPLDADHINYEVTVEDPKVFTRPWRMSMILYRHKETERCSCSNTTATRLTTNFTPPVPQ